MFMDNCKKCLKKFSIEELIYDDCPGLCKSCDEMVEKKQTICSKCEYFTIEDCIIDDYPYCTNKNSNHYLEVDFYIPLNLECEYFIKKSYLD